MSSCCTKGEHHNSSASEVRTPLNQQRESITTPPPQRFKLLLLGMVVGAFVGVCLFCSHSLCSEKTRLPVRCHQPLSSHLLPAAAVHQEAWTAQNVRTPPPLYSVVRSRALAGLVQHTVSQLLDEVVQTLFAASEILLARALITVQVALDGGSTPPAERTRDGAAGATIRGQRRGDDCQGLLLALDQEPLELPARTLLHGRTRLPDSMQRAHHHARCCMELTIAASGRRLLARERVPRGRF